MDFIFQGFQSVLPFWSYLLIFIGTVLLAWWSYNSISGIRPAYRYVLIGLRSAVFFVLLILLLNPFIKTEIPYVEKPGIMVMLDNSASTGIQKNGYNGTESYRSVLEKLNLRDSSSVNFRFFTVGSNTNESLLDSLTFKSAQTNLSEAMRSLKANQAEATAAIVISDGIYTQGQNPVFELEDLEIPIFTVGLGDTTTQKDILIRSVSTNSTGYLDTQQPVSVSVSSKGFRGQPFQVQLRDGGEILSSQTVAPDLDTDNSEVSFELNLTQEGLQQYEVVVPRQDDEWTGDNNTQRFSVDVQDARQQILSLAFEIHPDVKYLRSLLLSDKNTDLTKRTWLNSNRFIEGEFNPNPDSVDLAIIHGYPQSGLSSAVESQLQDLAENVPLIVAATPLFAPQQFEQEISSLPVQILGRWQYERVSISPQEDIASHPIMELPAVEYEQFPTLRAPVENLDSAPASTTLFSSLFQGQHTQKPVLAIQELGNRRMAFFSTFDWFRFNQNTSAEVREFVRQLLLNTVSWTATDPDNKLLDVEPVKTSFTGSEDVIINAYLTNERGEVEDDAAIDVSISSDTADTRFYSMENIGAGQYRLDLGGMPEGIYSFEATAEKGDRQLDTQSGEFAVAESNAEFLNTTRNDQLLRQVAERSGGRYLPFDSLSGFWDAFNQRELLEQNEKVRTTYFYPYQHIGWFVLVVLLLATEWMFRKYLSLP